MLTVDGDVLMGPGATLEIDIVSATVLDTLIVGGQLSAGGILELVLDPDAPPPQPGDSFRLIDPGSVTGTFDQIVASPLAPGDVWDLRELYTNGVVSVRNAGELLSEFVGCLTGPDISPPGGCEPQDQDGDYDVDLCDFATQQAGLIN
jgi:hypothetical protein